MKYDIVSEVIVEGIGKMIHEHTQIFEDGSNVFGRVLEYRRYMYKTFPHCDFRLIKATERTTTTSQPMVNTKTDGMAVTQ